MRQMSNLEYAAVVRELQPLLGKRFGRIRKLDGEYRMKIGDAEVIAEPGVRLHRTKYVEEAGTPDQLEQKTNSELENSKLAAIRQINNDRIIEFEFESTKSKSESGLERVSVRVVFEMFGKGNVILVKGGKTLAAMKEEGWSDREIRKGKEYKYPKSGSVATFREALTDRYVIIALLRLPLGKEYAQEILARSGIPEKTSGVELTGKQIEAVEKAIGGIKAEQKPLVYYGASGKPVDFGLCNFSKYKSPGPESGNGSAPKAFATLNEALDEYYWNAERETPNPELEKLERRLDEQQHRLAELEKEEQDLHAKGDFIYANYESIERLLKEAGSVPLEQLEKRLEKLKAKVDKKNKTVEVELP